MLTDREMQETIAQCVAIAVYYRGADRTGQMSDRMTSEVRAIALGLGERGVSAIDARGMIIEPVGRELLARFGPADGPRVADVFADAFAGVDPDAEPSPNGRWRHRAKGKTQGVA